MGAIGLTVLANGPGEKIPISFTSRDGSVDISISPIQALNLAEGLIKNARISMCGPKENPIEELADEMVMLGEGLDIMAYGLAEAVKALPLVGGI